MPDCRTVYLVVATQGEDTGYVLSKHTGFEQALDKKPPFGTTICVTKSTQNFKVNEYLEGWREMQWAKIPL